MSFQECLGTGKGDKYLIWSQTVKPRIPPQSVGIFTSKFTQNQMKQTWKLEHKPTAGSSLDTWSLTGSRDLDHMQGFVSSITIRHSVHLIPSLFFLALHTSLVVRHWALCVSISHCSACSQTLCTTSLCSRRNTAVGSHYSLHSEGQAVRI